MPALDADELRQLRSENALRGFVSPRPQVEFAVLRIQNPLARFVEFLQHTGDGLIVFQYQQATNNDTSRGYATVGIQNGQDGLNWTYYNRYAPGARTLGTGRAIAFVPTAPAAPAAIAVDPGEFDLQVQPGGSTQVALEITSAGAAGSLCRRSSASRRRSSELRARSSAVCARPST